MLKKIGEILKNAREDKDLTQLQVMKETGINNKTLSGYENGIAEPDIETMAKLFNFYGISADEALEIKTTKSENILLKVTSLENRILNELSKLSSKEQKNLLIAIKAINESQNNID
jgi:transcriptional regulator with XRE-family HTH domain